MKSVIATGLTGAQVSLALISSSALAQQMFPAGGSKWDLLSRWVQLRRLWILQDALNICRVLDPPPVLAHCSR